MYDLIKVVGYHYADEMSLSDSDSSDDIEMLWGSERDESSREAEGLEIFQSLVSELHSEVCLLVTF